MAKLSEFIVSGYLQCYHRVVPDSFFSSNIDKLTFDRMSYVVAASHCDQNVFLGVPSVLKKVFKAGSIPRNLVTSQARPSADPLCNNPRGLIGTFMTLLRLG